MTHKETNLVRFAAEVAVDAVVGDPLEVDMRVYTGASVIRHDWETGSDYMLRLGLDAGQCDFARLNGAPLLDSHMDGSVENVLGVCKMARIEGGALIATARFSDDEESMQIVQKVRNGTLRSVSVGAVIEHLKLESDGGEGVMASYVADKWYPREVSIVPIPADPQAGFMSDQLPIQKLMDRPAADNQQLNPGGLNPQEENMAETTPIIPAGEVNLAAINAARDEGMKAERDRVNGIQAAVKAARLETLFATDLINNGVSLADARTKIIDEMARQCDATASNNHQPSMVTQDLRDKQRDGIQNAIEYRANSNSVKLEAGREYASMTMLRLAEESLRQSGAKLTGTSSFDIAGMALGLKVANFAPGYSGTTDFPNILANVMNKSLRAAYDAYPQTWRPIARGTTMTDFKTKYVNQLSEMPTPVLVGPSGEFKYVKVTDKRESYALSTYGNVIAINRQSIVNDDLSAFSRIPTLQGRACAQLESDIVWALITSNPTMGADSVALFDNSTHGNYDATGTVISQTSLGVMRKKLRLMKNVQSVEYLNVEARFIAVPAALETVALQQTSNQYTPQQGSNINTFKNLNVIVEPRLDAASGTAWYGFADPGQIDIIEYAYLAGQEGIFTETRIGFEIDGMELKVREDFGAQILDWRGCYKNVGA